MQFFNDPLVTALYGLAAVAVLNMVMGMYRASQQGSFDWQKVPGILRTAVLDKIVPLFLLGLSAVSVPEGPSKVALLAAYSGGALAAYTGEVAALIEKITGSFKATTVAEDKTAAISVVAPAQPVMVR